MKTRVEQDLCLERWLSLRGCFHGARRRGRSASLQDIVSVLIADSNSRGDLGHRQPLSR